MTIGESSLGSFRLGSTPRTTRVGSFLMGNQRLGVSGEGLRVGSFSLGTRRLSTAGTEGATALAGNAVTFPVEASPGTAATAEASKAIAGPSAAAASATTAATSSAATKTAASGGVSGASGTTAASSGQTTAAGASAAVSDPGTRAASGAKQTAGGTALSAAVNAATTTDTVSTTAVSGTALASSGQTAAAGAETLSVDGAPNSGAATTGSTADPERASLSAAAGLATASTSASAAGQTASGTAGALVSAVSIEVVSPASTQSAVGSGAAAGALTSTTAGTAVGNPLGTGALGGRTLGASKRAKTRLSASPGVADSVAAKTGFALLGAAQTGPRRAGPLAEGISGNTTAAEAGALLAEPLSEAAAPGDVGVLAAATTKAGSAFTAVTGGETLRITADPLVVDPFTETTTDTDKAGDRRVGGFGLGTTDVGFVLRPLLQTAKTNGKAVDPLAAATGGVPSPTGVMTNAFLVESVGEGIAGSTTSAETRVFGASATAEAVAGEIQQMIISLVVASGTTIITGEGLVVPVSAGGTTGTRYLDGWALYPGPTVLGDTTGEKRTWNSLEVELRTDGDTLDSTVEDFDSDSGSVSIAETSDGGFITEDTAGGENTYELAPPTDRTPLRVGGDFLVADYEDSVADSQGDVFDVALELVPDSPRDTDVGADESNTSGEWYFDFEKGAVSTARVSAEVSSKSSDGTETRTINAVLTHEQAATVEESCVRQAAVHTRVVQDGTNITEDNSPGSTNTVYIDPPDGENDVITEGDYAVTSWVSTLENDRYQRVEISVSSV